MMDLSLGRKQKNSWCCSFARMGLTVAFGIIASFAIYRPAHAIDLYVTSIEGSQIDRVNTVTNSVVTLFNTPSGADSIIFDAVGRIVYTDIGQGQLRRFDPTTSTDSLLAAGLNSPADLVLEPGGGSVLVSEYGGGVVDRVNLTTNVVTPLLIPGGTPEGSAYDPLGRLFINLGDRNAGLNGKFVAQVNPITGAIIGTTAGLNSLDGLTYDPFSNKLYASSLFGGFIYQIDPNNLANVNIMPSSSIGLPDGITTDGVGNLYIASRNDFHIYQYDLNTNTLTQKAFVFGLDDLAPASGLGAFHAPEPGSLALLLGTGLFSGGLFVRRRRG